jgi:Ca-activated chloride channel family protein
MRKIVSLITTLLFISFSWSQTTGELKGTVTEQDGGTGIPFANVMLEQNGKMITGQPTDIDGNFWIKNIQPGTYDLKITSAGLSDYLITGVIITPGTITIHNVKMKSKVTLKEYVVQDNNTKSNTNVSTITITQADIKRVPVTMGETEIVNSLIVTPGVVSSYDLKTSDPNFAGSRKDATVFVDGVKIRGGNKSKNKSIIEDPYHEEEYSRIVENKFTSPFTDPLSTFSVDVDKASYSNIRRMINDGMAPNKNSVRLEEMINYFSYDYPQPTGQHPFSINLESASCPWETKHQIVSIGIQGRKIDPQQIPASNLVFLIDVSGSMSDYNKLPLVKSSLTALVSQLRSIDKVSIVVYAGAAGMVLSPTPGDNKKEILNALNNLQSGGSTAGGAGIKLAYDIAEKNLIKDGNNRIVLCTDGDFNVGLSSNAELEDLIVSERDKGVFLTVLGYGMGNYKDDKMEILADKGNGNYSYIDSQLEADKVLVKEMSGTLYTIAKDVKIQIEFNPAVVKSYRLIGYENRLLQDWEFNDDKRDAGEIGAGHSVTAIYEIEYVENQSTQNENLKYQSKTVNNGFDNEMLTVKFRYKQPKDSTSILIEKTIAKASNSFESASENLRFAATVAQFGMLLRNSEYKGTTSFDGVIEQAKNSKTFDGDGYRAEFINLVKASKPWL